MNIFPRKKYSLPPFNFQWFLDDVEVTNPFGSYNWNGNNVLP